MIHRYLPVFTGDYRCPIPEIQLLVLYFSTQTVFSLAKVVNVSNGDLSVPPVSTINTTGKLPIPVFTGRAGGYRGSISTGFYRYNHLQVLHPQLWPFFTDQVVILVWETYLIQQEVFPIPSVSHRWPIGVPVVTVHSTAGNVLAAKNG